jgi:diguanylate cyclase (GGDEF)-like protein
VFSLAIVDLDRFKALNDSRGHHTGDKALKLLAEVLRENTRESDSIARLGGDEFAIVMPNTRAEDCAALCRQLTTNIAVRMADADFGITASVGHATFEQPPESSSAALHEADKAMYAAKSTGEEVRIRAGTPT